MGIESRVSLMLGSSKMLTNDQAELALAFCHMERPHCARKFLSFEDSDRVSLDWRGHGGGNRPLGNVRKCERCKWGDTCFALFGLVIDQEDLGTERRREQVHELLSPDGLAI